MYSMTIYLNIKTTNFTNSHLDVLSSSKNLKDIEHISFLYPYRIEASLFQDNVALFPLIKFLKRNIHVNAHANNTG